MIQNTCIYVAPKLDEFKVIDYIINMIVKHAKNIPNMTKFGGLILVLHLRATRGHLHGIGCEDCDAWGQKQPPTIRPLGVPLQ